MYGVRLLDLGPCVAQHHTNTFCNAQALSALGQKRTYAVQKAMSALPPKADILRDGDVYFSQQQTSKLTGAECSAAVGHRGKKG